MNAAATAGAQRVGWLGDLDDVQRLAVRWLRHWERDPKQQAELHSLLASGLGVERARNAVAVFGDLMEIGGQYGRRQLCRHGCSCRCLGADEAVFAHMVSAAANGETEDAALLAALVVRPDMAMCFAGLAAEFGMALAAASRVFAARPRPSRSDNQGAKRRNPSEPHVSLASRPTLH
ncbi:hypothetical protein [Shimia sp.]|uniref:hypothetical protein n=1 Tax=Shimia sp. TaxID=1954381 RepID=UPI003B8CB145